MYKLPNSISEDRLTAKNKSVFKAKQPSLAESGIALALVIDLSNWKVFVNRPFLFKESLEGHDKSQKYLFWGGLGGGSGGGAGWLFVLRERDTK